MTSNQPRPSPSTPPPSPPCCAASSTPCRSTRTPPRRKEAARREAAFAVLAMLHPRDPLEAMLAARIIAAHFHALDAFRRAADTEQPPALQHRYQGKAIALTRLAGAVMRELTRRQVGPALRRRHCRRRCPPHARSKPPPPPRARPRGRPLPPRAPNPPSPRSFPAPRPRHVPRPAPSPPRPMPRSSCSWPRSRHASRPPRWRSPRNR